MGEDAVRLPNDGRTDRKVKFTPLGGSAGTAVAVMTGLPEKTQKAAVALVESHPDEDSVGSLAMLAVVLLAQVGTGWWTGYQARKGLRDG